MKKETTLKELLFQKTKINEAIRHFEEKNFKLETIEMPIENWNYTKDIDIVFWEFNWFFWSMIVSSLFPKHSFLHSVSSEKWKVIFNFYDLSNIMQQ